MRSIDFVPFSCSSSGFDRLFEMLDEAIRAPDSDAATPPYNIQKVGEAAYRKSTRDKPGMRGLLPTTYSNRRPLHRSANVVFAEPPTF